MANNWDILAVGPLNAILQELRDVREIPQNLRFLNRIAVREATDGELMGRFRGDVLISDIIFEGARAVVKNTDRFTTETFKIPKIKHGVLIDEEMSTLLYRITNGGGIAGDRSYFENYVVRKEADILLGIRQRLNAMVVAMLLDSFSYSMGGVVITNASWGVPAQFKSTPSVLWSSTTATPITDISAQVQSDLETYGEERNRITLSTKVLRYIFATDEFKNKAQLYAMMTFPTGAFPLTQELGPQINILQTILGMAIETEDSRYWDMLPDGRIVSAPYLPPNKVILSNTADDNSEAAAFLGNAIVQETVLGSIADVGGVEGRFGGPSVGPVSYSVAGYGMNPPDVTIWGVQKAWPVRVRPGLTSVLTVY